MNLTGVRPTTYYYSGRKKLPAWVAHHHCGWASKMCIGIKKSGKAKSNPTLTPGYYRAKRLLTIHRWVCKVAKTTTSAANTNLSDGALSTEVVDK